MALGLPSLILATAEPPLYRHQRDRPKCLHYRGVCIIEVGPGRVCMNFVGLLFYLQGVSEVLEKHQEADEDQLKVKQKMAQFVAKAVKQVLTVIAIGGLGYH